MRRLFTPILLAAFVCLCLACGAPPARDPSTQPPKTTKEGDGMSVTGTVIEVDVAKRQVLLVAPVGDQEQALLCAFREDEAARLLKLKKGDKIRIMGKFPANKGGAIALEQCWVWD